jgi:hypothetical protein
MIVALAIRYETRLRGDCFATNASVARRSRGSISEENFARLDVQRRRPAECDFDVHPEPNRVRLETKYVVRLNVSTVRHRAASAAG